MSAVSTFEEERDRLLGLAYRITGSQADADDVVQEAWLRWDRSDQATVERPGAWLTTVTSRIALDRLRAAQRAREAYVGPWLPEIAVTEAGPAERAELAESLTVGFLAVLERLGPVERVVFLLADVFSVPFDEIAGVVERSPEACRQIARALAAGCARSGLASGPPTRRPGGWPPRSSRPCRPGTSTACWGCSRRMRSRSATAARITTPPGARCSERTGSPGWCSTSPPA